MSTPSHTTRQTPSGIYIPDGYQTLITFARYPNVAFWEKTVKPSGFDGGDAIDTTTMHNARRRTKAPRHLTTRTDCTGKAAFDPNVITTIIDMVNVPDTITTTYPDGTKESEYGYLKMAEFGELAEGSFPELDFTIVYTSYDATNHVEASGLLTAVSGT